MLSKREALHVQKVEKDVVQGRGQIRLNSVQALLESLQTITVCDLIKISIKEPVSPVHIGDGEIASLEDFAALVLGIISFDVFGIVGGGETCAIFGAWIGLVDKLLSFGLLVLRLVWEVDVSKELIALATVPLHIDFGFFEVENNIFFFTQQVKLTQ